MSETGQIKTDAATPDSEEYRLVRPTLYIGIGGTGAAILTALRRRILQTQWGKHRLESLDDFKVASFLYFDTDSGEAKDKEARRKENEPVDPLAPLVALPKGDCLQGNLDPDKYLKQDPQLGTAELDNYPQVKEWLPAEKLSSINIDVGAGQVRSISRLLFFERVNELQTQISTRLRALMSNLQQKDLLNEQNLRTTDKVSIKIVGSASGGTGSGSFIDIGYLASSMRDPKPRLDDVELWLVLGSAFSDQGTRVMANTYAALAELEYAMKLLSRDPNYVNRWDRSGNLKPLTKQPFGRLYLFDSINTQRIGVGAEGRDYIFRMIADLLLQELAEPDLVGARRSDLSNQDQKYRKPFYVPTVAGQYPSLGLLYSRAYSGIGQSTIETRARIENRAQGAEVAARMLKAYFRYEAVQSKAPNTAAVDDYLETYLSLGPARQFIVHRDIRNPPVLSDYPLVFAKLLSGDSGALLDAVRNDVAGDFQRLMENPKLNEWPTLASDITKKRRNEIEQVSADPSRLGLTTRTAVVENVCRNLTAQLTANEGPIRKSLIGLVDSDIGGIWYACKFIEAIKAKLKAEWIARFNRDSDTYGQLAEKVMAALYQQASDNLERESKGGLMSGPNRERMNTIINQMKDTLTTWMQYRLRQIACKKAVEILVAVDAALGEASGTGKDGKPAYTGVLRDIHHGEDIVIAAIEELNNEATIIRDPDTAHNPIYQVIDSDDTRAAAIADEVVNQESYRALAAKALKEYNGASNVFSALDERHSRAGIISRLRRVASEEAGPSGRPILTPESEVPSLAGDLAKLPPEKAKTILKDAMRQAMPWINIDRSIIGDTWKDDMLHVFVSVSDSESFKTSEFGRMMKTALADCGFAGNAINYADTKSQGRLQICAELSGLPLDSLIQLHHDWYRYYEQTREDQQQAPLHTHVMWEKFGRPTAMDSAEMKNRLEDMGLFIQGVGFGLLRRRNGNVPISKLGKYEINMRAGLTNNNWIPVGRELKVRNFGLKSEHRSELQKELQEFLGEPGPYQLLAALALFEYFSQYHYRSTLVGDSERAGFGHLAASELAKTYHKRFDETGFGRKLLTTEGPDAVARRVRALVDAIDQWTTEIAGSLDDVDSREACTEDEDRRALPKRVVIKEAFADEALLQRLAEGKPAAAAAAKPAAAVAPVASSTPRYFWYVGADGKPAPRAVDDAGLAKLANEGSITAATKICQKGEKQWRPAGEWPEFAALFEAPPPLDDDDAPPPLN